MFEPYKFLQKPQSTLDHICLSTLYIYPTVFIWSKRPCITIILLPTETALKYESSVTDVFTNDFIDVNFREKVSNILSF